jgi:hypothetical protein
MVVRGAGRLYREAGFMIQIISRVVLERVDVVRVWLQANGVNVDMLASGNTDAHSLRLWTSPLDGRCLSNIPSAAVASDACVGG